MFKLYEALGDKTSAPLRSDMILHSSEGNFAIRKGPWKWIEGIPHPSANPGGVKHRQIEFHPQLYNLEEDLVEENNLIDKYPEIAKELAELL